MTSSALFEKLKSIIFEAAAEDERIGTLEESLKWGQPSFTPVKRNVGSSVRLSELEGGGVAAYFICTTKLVDRFREIYPDDFTYEGSRALIFQPEEPINEAALKHCIAMALTYKIKS